MPNTHYQLVRVESLKLKVLINISHLKWLNTQNWRVIWLLGGGGMKSQKGCFEEILKWRNLRKPFMIRIAHYTSKDNYQQDSQNLWTKNPHLPFTKAQVFILCYDLRTTTSTHTISGNCLSLAEYNWTQMERKVRIYSLQFLCLHGTGNNLQS